VRRSGEVPRPLPVEPVTTAANVVTLVRTVAAVAIAVTALTQESLTLVAVGYGVYWVGDILDGTVARLRHEETRHGGVFDVVSDRACTSLLAAGFIVVRPESAVPLGVFLVQFMVLDCVLTLAFLHWPIVSPNYFYVVDRRVWLLNWSQPAKAANTAAVVLCLVLGWIVVATVVAVAVVVVKLWSLREVARLIERKAAVGGPGAPVAEPAP
jgi:phosphatidylglycerophosphate synthase